MGFWSWVQSLSASASASASSFGRSSTAEEVTQGIDASNLTAIVTGATSGIGKETARVLALRGAKVIIPARTLERGLEARDSLVEQHPDSKFQVLEMDTSSLDSVHNFVESFNSSNNQLNILINNAGIMACPFQLSRDGVELQFATNHLVQTKRSEINERRCNGVRLDITTRSMKEYVQYILPWMKSTAKQTGIRGRIINVSSAAHRSSKGFQLDLEKLNDQSRYQRFAAYADSKLANILHANELSRRLKEDGSLVTANSLHPGLILTNIIRYFNVRANVPAVLGMMIKPVFKTIPQGAATTCYLALHPNVTDASGKYFENCNERAPSKYARDMELAKGLWNFSQSLVDKIAKGRK